jgi:hypothetical protein
MKRPSSGGFLLGTGVLGGCGAVIGMVGPSSGLVVAFVALAGFILNALLLQSRAKARSDYEVQICRASDLPGIAGTPDAFSFLLRDFSSLTIRFFDHYFRSNNLTFLP